MMRDPYAATDTALSAFQEAIEVIRKQFEDAQLAGTPKEERAVVQGAADTLRELADEIDRFGRRILTGVKRAEDAATARLRRLGDEDATP